MLDLIIILFMITKFIMLAINIITTLFIHIIIIDITL